MAPGKLVKDDPYDTLVLSGGSVNGISTLGVLQYMYDNNKLQHVKNYFGTSIGSVICYLLILGYNPTEILLNVISEKLIDNYKKINVVDIANGNGGFKWKSIDDFLINCTLAKCEQPMSFEDIWKRYNVHFACNAYNVNKKKIEYFSYLTHPKLLCTAAIRMSCNIPLLFPRYRYLDNYYIDGGIVDNFPILQASPKNIVFGIYLEISTEVLNKKLNKSQSVAKQDNGLNKKTNKDINSEDVNSSTEKLNKDVNSENLTKGDKSKIDDENESNINVENKSNIDDEIVSDTDDENKSNIDDEIASDTDEEMEGCDEITTNDIDFTLQDYIAIILATPLTYHINININKFIESIEDPIISEQTQILTIPTIKTSLHFNLTTLDQLEMFSHGYQYVKTYYE
jgi:predicted acylesterase/phospholipase RssA